MNCKKLNVRLVKQEKGSSECGLASLLMVFDFNVITSILDKYFLVGHFLRIERF